MGLEEANPGWILCMLMSDPAHKKHPNTPWSLFTRFLLCGLCTPLGTCVCYAAHMLSLV